jgi:hypothetical protein
MDEADSFVTETVRKNALDLSFSPEVIWSSRTGLTFNSKASLDVDVPIATSFGGLRIHDLKLKLARSSANGDPVFEVEASTGLDVQLGPVVASIDRIGLRMGFDFAAAQKNLGFVDLGFGFKPPTGVGVAVDAPAVSGGGYLFLDADKGQYAGVVRLNIEGGIAVTAIGLITTRLPSGAPGFSFSSSSRPKTSSRSRSVSASRSPASAASSRSTAPATKTSCARAEEPDVERRAVSADPIKNAAHILGTFDHAFGTCRRLSLRARRADYLGLAADPDDGSGAMLELGNRTRLIVLGRVAAILPSEKNDLLRLQMNSLGVIDFDRGTIAVDAVLYDSRLVGKFPITGSMAMRVSWGADRVLALSIGGFHPAFKPPPAFPVLERLAITFSNSGDFKLRAESYLAITSNTLQFGAKVDLYASAGGFAIAGLLGYDVLIQFDPFAFVADLYASSVEMPRAQPVQGLGGGQLSGPRPLHIRGKATFEIFWCDVSVSFDKTLVSGERPPALGRQRDRPVDRRAERRTQLGRAAGGWRSRRGDVALAGDAAAIALHPLGTLSVKQTVVPLDLDIVSSATPRGGCALQHRRCPRERRRRDVPARARLVRAGEFDSHRRPESSRRRRSRRCRGRQRRPGGLDFTTNGADILGDESITYETILVDDDAPATRRRRGQRRLRQPVCAARRRGRERHPSRRTAEVLRCAGQEHGDAIGMGRRLA